MITLCTTLAVGMLLWSTAEPIYHLNNPPVSFVYIKAGSPEAALFSIAAMFLHWSFTPYAIYAVSSLVFALAFYNKRLLFSISSSLAPVFGHSVAGNTQGSSGIVAWTMESLVGIEDIRMLSNLGGLPALLIILATSLSLIKWIRKPSVLISADIVDSADKQAAISQECISP